MTETEEIEEEDSDEEEEEEVEEKTDFMGLNKFQKPGKIDLLKPSL